jgi:hypothetical protein
MSRISAARQEERRCALFDYSRPTRSGYYYMRSGKTSMIATIAIITIGDPEQWWFDPSYKKYTNRMVEEARNDGDNARLGSSRYKRSSTA